MNVLDQSSNIEEIISGKFPPSVTYKVNDVVRMLPYCLADGIYHEWAIFVESIRNGAEKKETSFSSAQEGGRKDIERAFGVLVARFHFLARPSRLFTPRRWLMS